MNFWNISNVFTPTSHNSFSSFTRGCKYTSTSFLGKIRPGINNDSMKEDLFMHIHGGRLYEIKTTSNVLLVLLIFPYRLNPSAANPSLTLQGSDENSMYLESNDFQASELAGYLNNPSFTWPSTCYFICLAVSGDINSHCNLGFKGNRYRIFAGFFFFFLKEALVLCWPLDSLLSHLERLHLGQASRLAFSF